MAARKTQQELYAHHLRAQFADRATYWTNRGISRTPNNGYILMTIDSMDQSKFCFPRGDKNEFQSKELSGLQRPKAHITLCLVHGYFLLFTTSQADLKKDSSTMTDILFHALHLLATDFKIDLSRTFINVQSDNTSRETKNNTWIRAFSTLTAHGFSFQKMIT